MRHLILERLDTIGKETGEPVTGWALLLLINPRDSITENLIQGLLSSRLGPTASYFDVVRETDAIKRNSLT